MISLGLPEVLIGLLLLAKLSWTVYIRLHPEANVPRYDFETW
jgi:hypothetical protein